VLSLAGPALAVIPLLALEYWLGPRGLLLLLTMWLFVPLGVRFASPPNYAYTIRHHRSGRVFGSSMPGLWASILQSMIFVVLLVVLVAQGYRLHGEPDPALLSRLSVTDLLGRAFFWLGNLFCGYLAVATFWIFFVRRPNEDPSQLSAPVLWVPPPSLGPGARAEAALNAAGYVVSRASRFPRAQDVDLALFDARPSFALPPGVPGYGVQASDWDAPELVERVRRLEMRAKRRRALSSMRQLLESASAHSYRRGEGFFFAPQCWLIDGLQRDEVEQEDALDAEADSHQRLAPLYQRLFDIRLRRHLHAVLRSADLDVIFVEDGLQKESVLMVLERLLLRFESGHNEPLQEHELQGLIGLRAHIQQIGLDRPLRSLHKLREPRYDDISRARILLLVRDRGLGDDDDDPHPPEATEDTDRWLRESLRNLFPPALTL
jgi:hypothetical protein